jgi:hypothetical protein
MKLELKQEQVNLILQALAQLPYAQVVGLIEEILDQVKPKEEKNETVFK